MTFLLAMVLLSALDSRTHAEPATHPEAAVEPVQPPPDTTAAGFWADFAESRKYQLKELPGRDLLVLLPKERSKPERAFDLIERALARVDALLPQPAPDAARTPANSLAPSRSPATPEAAAAAELWGDADRPLDTGTMVVGLFRKPSDFAAALEALGEAFPYMASWASSAKNLPGCILERPLFGACVDNVPGMQEWSPDHELVHRAAQLATIRRSGRQPVWVGLGMGWNVEFDLLKSIYCFPWRDSFVRATEHGGWDSDLRRAFEKRKQEPVQIAELAGIKRGGFEVGDAAVAWGFVRFLARHHGERLPALLREFNARRDVLGRVPTGDGRNWTMAADFELPAEEQERLIGELVATDALQQAADWFRLGANWKKPTVAKK
jgi:hypothetical protein